ncbi:MAG TPA: DNA polymerase III subunit gamma and tau, partial [Pilimelia sp.]|nr:DNA polymerase III subunit gamma and tau [Pilimelia sp.]
LIAGAGPEGVSYARAVALLGVTDAALIDEMCDALAAGDGAAAYAAIDRVSEAGHDPRRFAADLLERLRDLIVLQQVPDAVAKGLLDAPADQLERMSAQAQRLGAATLSRCADIVHNGLVEMRGTTAPRLLLELICARMLLPGAEDSTGSLLQRLERMERRLTLAGGDAPPPAAGSDSSDLGVRPTPAPAPGQAPAAPPSSADAPAPPPVPAPPSVPPPSATPAPPQPPRVPPEAIMPDPATPEPEPPGAAAPGVLDAAAVRRVWDEVLGTVSRKSKRDAAVVREATVREVDGETLVLSFRHRAHADMLAKSPERLLEAIYEVLGGRWEIRCELAGDQRSAASAPRGAAPSAGAARPSSRPAAESSGGQAAPGDTDWPEPARPGGSAAGGGAPATPGAPGAGKGQGGTALSGGAVSTGDAGHGVALGKGSGQRGAGTPSGPGQGGPGRGGPGQGQDGSGQGGSGRAAARAVASGRGSSQDRGASQARGSGPGRATAAGSSGGAWGDAPPPDEPPYDPDYDGPVGRSPARFDGFDPGDEPLDDVVDEATARQTSEQQALQLLQQALGAEKIGEVDAR